jgi:hypothetical protein
MKMQALLEQIDAQELRLDSRIRKHFSLYQELETQSRQLRKRAQELLEADALRRQSVQERWMLRGQIRKAREIMHSIKPVPAPARIGGIRSNVSRAKELLSHEMYACASPISSAAIGPGIYALFDGDALVYIGQSTNVYWRVGQHMAEKQFTSACYVSVPKERLDEVERLLLDVYLPVLNQDSKTRSLRRQQMDHRFCSRGI